MENLWTVKELEAKIQEASEFLKGKRGQQMLMELAEALDAMPDKRLIRGDLKTAEGDVCALGALAQKRGLDVDNVDPEDHEAAATTFHIAHALACEVMYVNDDWSYWESEKDRWKTVRKWVANQLKVPA